MELPYEIILMIIKYCDNIETRWRIYQTNSFLWSLKKDKPARYYIRYFYKNWIYKYYFHVESCLKYCNAYKGGRRHLEMGRIDRKNDELVSLIIFEDELDSVYETSDDESS
jgi:hypothetical protein